MTVFIPRTEGCYSPDYPTEQIGFNSEAEALEYLERTGREGPTVEKIELVVDVDLAVLSYNEVGWYEPDAQERRRIVELRRRLFGNDDSVTLDEVEQWFR